MADGILAQLKVLIGADVSGLKSGLNEAAASAQKSSKRIEKEFHSLGSAFSRILGPLSETGRQVSVAIDAIGASAAEANKSLSALGTTFAVVGSVATAGLLALGGATLKLFETLDATAHAAEGVGMGVAQYTELTEALKIYDINQEQANMALAYFDKIISGLTRSKAGITAIQELGLNLQQLQKMNPHDALLTIADAFSKLQNGTQKAGLAAALFGNTYGVKLIPFLNQGRQGIEQLEGKFRTLGEATQANAEAAENLKIAWEGFKSGLESVVLEISDAFGIPTMLEAIAHPLKTLQVLILGFGDIAVGVFAKVADAIDFLVKEINAGLASLRLPQIPTATLGEASRYLHALSDAFGQEAGKIAEGIVSPGHGSGGGGTLLPPSGSSQQGGGGTNRAAAYIAQLRQELAKLGRGDAAQGLERLKELGATQAQLSEGKNLLDAIQSLKDEQKFAEQFAHTQKSMKSMLDKLSVPKETVDGWNALADASGRLLDNIEAAGRSALGLQQNYSELIKQQAEQAAGIGNGPIGGLTPTFTPSGFGQMRFNMEKLGEDAQKLGETFSHSFIRMIEGGQSFGQMLQSLRQEFELFIIKALVFQQIANALKGAGGFLGVIGNFFGGLATPGRALGGPVQAGSLYRVGENGPEYFSPNVSGTIVPMDKTQQQPGRPLVYAPVFNINTPNADSFRKSQAQLLTDGYRQMAAMHARNS